MRPTIAIFALIGLLAVIVGTALHTLAGKAYACSAPAIPLEVRIENSDSIFSGRVVSIDSLIVNSDKRQREVESFMARSGVDGDVAVRSFEAIVEFRVTEVWKGELYETMYFRSAWEQIRTPIPMPCPPTFHSYVTGETYLVFARGGQANIGSSTTTRLMESATSLLEELGTSKLPNPGTVGPIPERKGQPVKEQSGGGCGLTPGYTHGNINLSAIGLTALLAWFWIRRRFRR